MIREATVVHHIFPAEEYPEYEWEDWNLISISQEIHNRLHDRNTRKLTENGRKLMQKTARKYKISPHT